MFGWSLPEKRHEDGCIDVFNNGKDVWVRGTEGVLNGEHGSAIMD